MTAPRPRTAVSGSPVAHTAAYERLRREAVAVRPAPVRQGPAALALRGVAAWLGTASEPALSSEHRRRPALRAPAPAAPTVEVLVDMIRAHLPGEAA